MASKRKSTVPCMIPSKSKHVREEIILGSLPELLPTIPEDSILSISGGESGHFSHSSSKSESGSEMPRGGTYSCPACRFESRDLNYFLDHMHNCHLDFRAQPTFYCLNCGVSVVRFEALALHNANAHPKIMEGLVTASLSVNKRDRVTTVEQSLFTESGEDYKESGISLSKTPIAKMMKAKGEHKKIVVSHTVEVRKIDTGKDVDPSVMTNVPELQNGALSVSSAPAMPRTTVNHMTTVSNQVFHQHTPSLYSAPSSASHKDLPKVMIPLSSIPTYDAAMDTSSFLKTSFGKFPYPTKAELCYLTVVSDFPEEQIKLWFTAQRLKQGISWSPEEIEEARRKMFNTVFQGGAPQKQPAVPRHVNHIVTHHTVTAQPGAKGPNFPMAKVPFGGLRSRPLGVIATQASMSTNPNVTRVSYSTPIIPPKFPPAVRTTQVQTKSAQPTLETVKSNGVGPDVAASGGFVSSTSSSRSSSSSSSCSRSSSISSYCSSSNGGETVARRPVHSGSPTRGVHSAAPCSAPNISNNDEHCAAAANGKAHPKSNCLPSGSDAPDGSGAHATINSTSKSSVTCNNHDGGGASPQERAHAAAAKHDNEPPNNHVHYSNNSINSEYAGAAATDGVPNPNHASKALTESTSTTVITKSLPSILDEGKCNKDLAAKGMSILKQLIKEEDPFAGERGCPEPRVEPIKINFKRLKMNEPEAASDGAHPEHKPEAMEASPSQPTFSPPTFSPPWSSKTPQQLHVLRQVFSNTRWPSSQQYEDLSVQTGLPKSEVVRWFSDSRYSHKNGQLKWLETYQRPPAESEEAAKKKMAEKDTFNHLEGDAGLNSGQQAVWRDSYSPLLGLMEAAEGRGAQGQAEGPAPPEALQDPWSERAAGDRPPPAANQTLLEPQADVNQARDRLRMELLEV